MTQNNQEQEKALLPLGLWRYYTMILYESLLLFAVLFFAGVIALPFSHAENSLIYALYLVFVSFFYFGWQWKRSGQTLAMSTWKVRLVQDNGTGTQISWWQAVRRFVVASAIYFIFSLACYLSFSSEPIMWLASLWWVVFFLSAVNPWFDIKRRMWQDLASGTRLLKEV
ncbi:MAG: RDD family protein [Thiotrichaceae bacterium]|nr:RDD family protein [Thiotrichaceae bacterium]